MPSPIVDNNNWGLLNINKFGEITINGNITMFKYNENVVFLRVMCYNFSIVVI